MACTTRQTDTIKGQTLEAMSPFRFRLS
ncbi:unnamed protein product [Oppiella nova]|uniref:Uncharacterized protein n=1 Tax=Oppiella nova TaxID=334625 RepID=A0A7R9MT87_9ACAR|nr:unnamed protein product [Oppiella nova]CAG2183236.1 unnamed protein product [Oppiella nova]